MSITTQHKQAPTQAVRQEINEITKVLASDAELAARFDLKNPTLKGSQVQFSGTERRAALAVHLSSAVTAGSDSAAEKVLGGYFDRDTRTIHMRGLKADFESLQSTFALVAKAPEDRLNYFLPTGPLSFNKEDHKSIWLSQIKHELTHADKAGRLRDAPENGDIAAYEVQYSELNRRLGMQKPSPDRIVSHIIMGYPPDYAATQVASHSLYSFGPETRKYHPGGSVVEGAFQGRIARLKFFAEQSTSEEEKSTFRQMRVEAQNDLLQPMESAYAKALQSLIADRARDEFYHDRKLGGEVSEKSLSKSMKAERDVHVEKRLGEYKEYLAGERDSFRLTYHRFTL